MASKKDIEMVKVKALKNIKYNTTIVNADDEFEINKVDEEELVKNNLVKVLEVIITQEEEKTNTEESK
ncbi:hypothetical protein [Clostridium scatologenes]|uniref:DUF7210 domain-containing protein n=1 Tax=Clostridium scatologenes TaxID=1548 RepID=A0A0E3MA24_CLOSL|nr:hypothetical protein [Clostridium scatologenes]AKA70138.1 hypothetical protein CSCA_3013 [Clostridium scatologenes]